MKTSKLEKYKEFLSTNRLKLILLPTEKCNFRCFYCYENYQHGAMSKEMAEGVKRFLTHKTETIKLLDVEWFGGEPTLAKDIVIDISKHIQLLAKKQNFTYVASMTTNGYLLNKTMLNNYCNVGINSFQITLDGTPENHNITRILANGKKTFDTIWNNLQSAKETNLNFTILLRLHYFLDTYTDIVPLIQHVDETFLIDKRFMITFKPIRRWGSKNDDQIKSINDPENDKIQKYLKLFVTKKESILHIDTSAFVCPAAHTNAMIIRSNGDINKCTLVLNEAYNNVGKLNSDGTITLDVQKFLAWSKGFETLDTEWFRCPNKFMKSLNKYLPDEYPRK
jgi:uncharacterized protein